MYQEEILSLPSWGLESSKREKSMRGSLKFLINTMKGKENEQALQRVHRAYGIKRHVGQEFIS